MCIQLPDNLILKGRKVSIEPLPMLENSVIIYEPEKAMPMSTGHYRGYVAEWVITDQGLFLTSTEGCYQLKTTEPVFADWVTGTICPATGTYSESFNIVIENGRALTLQPT